MSKDLISVAYGREVAQRWLQTGWPGEIQSVSKDVASKDPARRNAGVIATTSFVSTLAAAIEGALASGVRFSVALPSPARLAYSLMRDVDDYARLSVLVINAAGALRQRGITFTWHRPNTQPIDTDAQVQLVSAAKELADAALAMVKAEQPARAEPLEVVIVGMPARETTTSVARDNRDNLLSTTQIERDAA